MLRNDLIPTDHPLVGEWVTEDEDSDAKFNIEVKNNKFVVTGTCISDGEIFVISNQKWDGKKLYFEALMPSTNFKSINVFQARQDGKAYLELTTYEIWKKN